MKLGGCQLAVGSWQLWPPGAERGSAFGQLSVVAPGRRTGVGIRSVGERGLSNPAQLATAGLQDSVATPLSEVTSKRGPDCGVESMFVRFQVGSSE